MNRNTIFRQFFWGVICFFAFAETANAFSYVYVQGDKKTPIYVKVEGVMLPRYGKNYALISRLAPGPMNIEILFQQNEFPPIQFNILVPEDGKRAFVLSKREGGFALFDVEQNFYLNANNEISEDHLPKAIFNNTILENTVLADEETKVSKEEMELKSDEKVKDMVLANTEPKFIDNITFNNDNEVKEATETVKNDGAPLDTKGEVEPTIINSDCKTKIGFVDFIKLKNRINSRQSEDEKLGFVLSAARDNCFETEQAKELVEKLETDIAKFSALKTLYPKISDQSNFPSLESVLEAEEWKSFFKELVQQ